MNVRPDAFQKLIQLTTIGAKTAQLRTLPLISLFGGERIGLIASGFGREHNPGCVTTSERILNVKPVSMIGQRPTLRAKPKGMNARNTGSWHFRLLTDMKSMKIVLGDDNPFLKLSFGEEIVIPTEDIVDWMIVEDGKLIGGYANRLSYERMSPEEEERFLEAIDYSMED
jgi:hypothetical protein